MKEEQIISSIIDGAAPEFTDADRAAVDWQYRGRLFGDFRRALWLAIERADNGNLDRLAAGFPNEVQGFRNWVSGDLGIRLRQYLSIAQDENL